MSDKQTAKQAKNSVHPNLNVGRKAGAVNRATKKSREAFALLMEGNVDRMQEWLDAIAKDPKHGPKAAFDCILDLAEYHLPKLARTELVGDPDAPIVSKIISWK